jgi:CubicO group peptidase (beta-lactamase class C family)
LFSPRTYGHTGFTGTSIWIDPENEIVAVLLTNRVHPRIDDDGTRSIALRHRFHNAVVRELTVSR